MEVSRRKILQRLEREGWYLARHGGNHDIYKHPDRKGRITLPRHKTIAIPVAADISKVAGWNE